MTVKLSNGGNSLNYSLRKRYNSQRGTHAKTELSPPKRKFNVSDNFVTPEKNFTDIGGYKDIKEKLLQMVVLPIKYPFVYNELGSKPTKALLFYGPPGTGKSLMAAAIAAESNATFLRISATEIVAGISGQSESRLRDVFTEAKKKSPCVLLIDELDSMCQEGSTTNTPRSIDRRISAQLARCLDSLNSEDANVIVIGTTPTPEKVDKSLRRGERFEEEIKFALPKKEERREILKVLSKKITLDASVNFEEIASRTAGYAGADLSALIRAAASNRANEIFKELEKKVVEMEDETERTVVEVVDLVSPVKKLAVEEGGERINFTKSAEGMGYLDEKKVKNIKMEDLLVAIKTITPGFKREGFTPPPETTWDEIGGLEYLKETLTLNVVYPISFPKFYRFQGMDNPCGIVLFGPPGCGKTLIARAVANQANASFISVKGPELLNSLVGESEKAIRNLFRRASICSPCIIFFDEIESLTPKRTQNASASEVSLRVVTQFLAELDGLEKRKGIFVLAATNRPDLIDEAILRPGRLGKIIHVPFPDKRTRQQIFLKHMRKVPLTENRAEIAELLCDQSEGFSGADCADVIKEASSMALKEFFSPISGNSIGEIRSSVEEKIKNGGVRVAKKHFILAAKNTRPSVSTESKRFYERIALKMR